MFAGPTAPCCLLGPRLLLAAGLLFVIVVGVTHIAGGPPGQHLVAVGDYDGVIGVEVGFFGRSRRCSVGFMCFSNGLPPLEVRYAKL